MELIVTLHAREDIEKNGKTVDDFVQRHKKNDWGIASEADRLKNEQSLKQGGALVSIFKVNMHQVIWVITTRDRSRTVVLTPAESIRFPRLLD